MTTDTPTAMTRLAELRERASPGPWEVNGLQISSMADPDEPMWISSAPFDEGNAKDDLQLAALAPTLAAIVLAQHEALVRTPCTFTGGDDDYCLHMGEEYKHNWCARCRAIASTEEKLREGGIAE